MFKMTVSVRVLPPQRTVQLCSSPSYAPSSSVPRAHPPCLQKHGKCDETMSALMSLGITSPSACPLCAGRFLQICSGVLLFPHQECVLCTPEKTLLLERS